MRNPSDIQGVMDQVGSGRHAWRFLHNITQVTPTDVRACYDNEEHSRSIQ